VSIAGPLTGVAAEMNIAFFSPLSVLKWKGFQEERLIKLPIEPFED
jgi:hypothetical protein